VARLAVKSYGGLQRDSDAMLDDFRLDGSREIEAPAHRAGRGQHMIYTRKIKIANVHGLSLSIPL
jgi:hypothetical protein